jgi:AraC family ethanolamine operon transcriptional activator
MKPSALISAPNKGDHFLLHERIQKEATDADQHAHNLTNWQQQYDQVSAGNFYGQLIEIQLDGLQLFQEHTSQALRQSCNTWDQSLWLGIPIDGNKSSKINGHCIEKNQIMCRPGNQEFELITPHNFYIYGLVVEQEKLQMMADQQGIQLNWQQFMQQGSLTLPEQTITSLRFILGVMLADQQHTRPAKIKHDVIMMALLESLQNSQPIRNESISFLRRQQIVAQVKDYLRLHQGCSVTIHDLCTLCHVSRRTLQYSFETILGISPLRYLRLSRLNGARRELMISQTDSVADIAEKWGFWHLSQFTQDYKQLFNELPSITLSKSA